MTETIDTILIRLIENIIINGHEHILANFRDKEKIFEYMRTKQQPALIEIEKVCRIRLSKIKGNQKTLFIKIIEQVAAYKGIVDLILKDQEKYLLINRVIENMNDAYEKLKDSIKEYKSAKYSTAV